MRRRTSHVWALAGSVALALLLALAWHPGVAAGPTAGMSAPAPARASVESAPAAKILQLHFDWGGQALTRGSLAVSPESARAAGHEERGTAGARQCYGPLYRRPPPSFS